MARRKALLVGPDNGSVPSPDVVYELDRAGVVLTTSNGPLRVLSDISFAVRRGEIVGVVGRSGTGKTTLLRVLGGLVPATSGEVRLDGHLLHGPPIGVATVFQDYASALLPWRTVARNVELPLERSLARGERRQRVAEALALVGLDRRGSEYPRRLSGGMQQRVQIARALALQPRVLLMDEPFGALDAMTRGTLQDELLRVQSETGATIVFITHDVEEAIYLSDRVLVIAESPGRITMECATGLARPRDRLVTPELARYREVRHQLYEALGQ